MLTRLGRLWQDRRGNAAIEFAVFLPLLLSVLAGLVELGRAYNQATALEKSVRAAAVYAARNPVPLSSDVIKTVANIVRTGTPDGSGPYLASGWGKSGSQVSIGQTSFSGGGATVPVIKVTAAVPFDPILPGLVKFVGLNDFILEFSHEQAHLDD